MKHVIFISEHGTHGTNSRYVLTKLPGDFHDRVEGS
jgi:hypothetical protein